MQSIIQYIYRTAAPGHALTNYLAACLEKPAMGADFPSTSGYDEYRGHLCVIAEISRRTDHQVAFRDLFKVSAGKAAQLRPSWITCSSNPELQGQTWESFCEQEGRNPAPGHGCRSAAEFRALDARLDSRRNVYRFGNEVIWSDDGNHRVAALAHFDRTQPEHAYGIDVIMHEYQLNMEHALVPYQFGLIRERERADPSVYELLSLFSDLREAVKLIPLNEGMIPHTDNPEQRFRRSSIIVFIKPTPAAQNFQRFIRENGLYWDLRQYFGIY